MDLVPDISSDLGDSESVWIQGKTMQGRVRISPMKLPFASYANGWSLAVLLSLSAFWFSSQAVAQLPRDRSDSAYLEALEQQQLFDVMGWYCRDQLKDQQLSSAQRSTFAAHWIRAATLSALNAPPEAQPSAWKQVEELSQRLLAESQRWDRHALVQFQSSLIGLARGRLARLQLKQGGGQQWRQQGLDAVRLSHDQLKQMQRDLVKLAAAASPRPTTEPDLPFSRPQFQALGNDVDFQILSCLEVRASLYPESDQTSRLDTFQQILELSGQLQPRLPMESRLWWQLQAISLEAARQLEAWDQWQSRWDTALLSQAPPESLGDMAAAQLLHDLDHESLALAQQRANEFLKLIQLRAPDSIAALQGLTDLDRATAWPSLDIARARLFLEQQAVQGEPARQKAEARLLQFLNVMAGRHGRFWASELTSELLAGRGNVASGSTAVSLTLVKQRLLEQQWDEVRDLIVKGMAHAVENGQRQQAFELATLAATTAGRSTAQPWMIRVLEDASLTFPEDASAATVHYWACLLAANLPDSADPTPVEIWQRQLERWPNGPITDQVRIRFMAPHDVSQQQWESVLKSLSQIPPSSESYAAAVQLMSAAFGDWILQLPDDPDRNKTADQIATTWVAIWKSQLQDQEGGWINRWNLEQKKLALLLIQAQLETANPNVAWTEELMRRIENRLPDLDAEGLSRKKTVETRMWFLKSPATFSARFVERPAEEFETNDLIWLARTMARELPAPGLTGQALSANQRGRAHSAAQLFLQLQQLLTQKELTSTFKQWMKFQQIQALLQLDRFDEAKTLAAEVSDQVNRLGFQQLLGYCLSGSNNPNDAPAAEKHWRQLTQKTREGTDAWYEAKYYLAEALRRQGKLEDAFRLLQYLKLTHEETWKSNTHQRSLNRLYESLAPQ